MIRARTEWLEYLQILGAHLGLDTSQVIDQAVRYYTDSIGYTVRPPERITRRADRTPVPLRTELGPPKGLDLSGRFLGSDPEPPS